MDTTQILGYIGALIVGLVLGLIGGGGSILTVPLLVYLLGYNPVVATAYSLFVVGTSSMVGTYQKHKKGLVDFKTGLLPLKVDFGLINSVGERSFPQFSH